MWGEGNRCGKEGIVRGKGMSGCNFAVNRSQI